MITLRYYPNPFDAERISYQFDPDQIECFPPKVRGEELIYFDQDRGIIGWEDIRDGDIITVTRKVQGKNTAKKILAPDGWMRWGMAVLTMGTSELFRPLGKMALDSLFPKTPKFSQNQESPTYNWEGVTTTAQVGLPIPLLYGEHLLGGNIIASYTREFDNKAEINILVAICEGPITSIAGITSDTNNADLAVIGDKLKLNDIPASELTGLLTVGVRMGEDVQTALPGFTVLREEVPTNNSSALQQNVDRTFRTRNTDVTGVSIQFIHEGLIDYNSDGTPNTFASYKVDVFYKLVTDSSYTYHGQYQKSGKTESALRGQYDILGLSEGQYDIKLVQKARNTEAGQRITTTKVLTVIEERDFALTYPGTALLSIRLVASDIISGSVNDIKMLCRGREVLMVNSISGSPYRAYSKNPIWILNDMVRDPVSGIGDSVQVGPNWPELYAEAQYHDEIMDNGRPRFELNVVIDSESKAIDQLGSLAASVLVDIFYNGSEIKLKTRKAQASKYLFNMSNIVFGSWSQTSSNWNDQYNYVSIDYFDAESDYERDSFVLEGDSLGIDGRGMNQLQRDARGITNRDQVGRLANYLLKQSNFVAETVTFTAFIDGIKIEPGDIVDVAHDVPQYGIASGIIISAGIDYIVLDRSVDLPIGFVYFLIKKFDDTMEEMRAGIELTGSGTTEHIPAGTPIYFNGPFAGPIPQPYDKYSIGLTSDTRAKPYRVENVVYRYDHEVEIAAVEHFDELYDDSLSAIEPPDYSYLPNPNLLPASVTDVRASSEASYYPVVRISYTRPPVTNDFGLWDFVEIFFSEDGGNNFQYYGKDSNGAAEIFGLAPAVDYVFRLVSVSTTGRRSATTATVNHTTRPALPPVVHGVELDEYGNGVESFSTDFYFKWRPVSTVPLASQIANGEAYGAGTGNVPEYITGYVVRAYPFYFPHGTATEVMRREEFVSQPQFDYNFSMNVLDPVTPTDYVGIPITAPERYVEIAVWARDKFNQLSPRPALFKAYNYPPELPDLPGVVPVQEFFTQRPIVKKFGARYYWTTPSVDSFFSLSYTYSTPFQTGIVTLSWPSSPDEFRADFVGYEIRLRYVGGEVKRFRQSQRQFQFTEVTSIGTPQIESAEIVYLDSYTDKIPASASVYIIEQEP